MTKVKSIYITLIYLKEMIIVKIGANNSLVIKPLIKKREVVDSNPSIYQYCFSHYLSTIVSIELKQCGIWFFVSMNTLISSTIQTCGYVIISTKNNLPN